MKEFEDFKKRQEIVRVADNTKMVVVGVLVLSIVVFTLIGKDAVKPIILHWAAFMTLLLVVCAIQDIANNRKIKRLGL